MEDQSSCDIPDLGKTVWVMGWSYEREQKEATESYGHSLSIADGKGLADPPTQQNNYWNRFTTTEPAVPGAAEVGSAAAGQLVRCAWKPEAAPAATLGAAAWLRE